jgi:threonine synthase
VSTRTVQATSLVCSGCGASPAPGEPYPFRCPNAGQDDDTDHVLRRRLDASAVGGLPGPGSADESPYVTYRRLFHAYHLGQAFGMADAEYVELVARLDEQVAAVDGHGFRVTPFARADRLSDRLGFAAGGGVWVKDETGNVSGSHKARHLFGLLVYLEVAERIGLVDAAERPALAIASCGNAALAAAVVAAAGRRRLDVFVPVDADPPVVTALKELGARVEACPRQPGVPGDPTYLRLRAAIAEGALPFTCQGNENGLAVEGGFTLGYEIAAALVGDPEPGAVPNLDRLVVQVGGGALASACFESLAEMVALGGLDRTPRFDAVQTAGAWPLPRAFERLSRRLPAQPAATDIDAALAYAARHRSAFMWPWEDEPRSIAHGILDDETYDWLAVVEGLLRSGGGALVVDEETLQRANATAVDETGIDVDPTGSSGLAGLLALRDRGEIDARERVGVLFTGVRR